MSEKEISTKDRNVGFELLCNTLKGEAKKYRAKALLTEDRKQRLIYEIKSLEFTRHMQRIIRGQSEKGSKGALRKTLRELSQKYEILSMCTNDPEKRTEYKRKSEQYKKDGEGI